RSTASGGTGCPDDFRYFFSRNEEGAMSRLLLSFLVVLTFVSPVLAEEQDHTWSSPGVSPSPGQFWKPPAGEPPKLTGAAPAPATPEIQNKLDWTLSDLIDFALKTGYDTQAAWHDAKAAAAEMGSKKGAYYPEVDLQADLSRIKSSAIGGQFEFHQDTF